MDLEHFSYAGYDLPKKLIELTGGGADNFVALSKAHFQDLQNTVGLSPNHSILEIGCGIGRDAIPLARFLIGGTYLGIDIIKDSIDWCTANISSRHPNLKFVFLDINDGLHNVTGTLQTSEVTVPLPARSVDRVIMWSVLTHMLKEDIEPYLREFQRVLKPDGKVFATCFIVDEMILAAAHRLNTDGVHPLRFDHQFCSGCFINDPANARGAVAYTAQTLDELLDAAGLAHERPIRYQNWSGAFPETFHGQDTVFLRLPA
jgi:SAM-dependent methyltransferase